MLAEAVLGLIHLGDLKSEEAFVLPYFPRPDFVPTVISFRTITI